MTHQLLSSDDTIDSRFGLPGLGKSRALLRTALVGIVALSLLGGAGIAAGSSLPGSSLYQVKRAAEQARLQLTGSASRRAQIHIALAGQRLEEAVRLAVGGGAVGAELLGDRALHHRLAWEEIQSLPPAEAWTVRQQYLAALQAQVDVLDAALMAAGPSSRAVLESTAKADRQELARLTSQGWGHE
jgi:hypothetical protein